MRRLCLALLCAAVLAAPATACLWDRDTNLKEKEFKSQYDQDGPAPSTSETKPTAKRIAGGALLGGGTVLLFGAGFALCLVWKRTSTHE